MIRPGCILRVEPGGSLVIGRHCSLDRDVEIVVGAGARLEIGDHVYVGHGTTIACFQSIRIGAETMIADLVSIRDMNHRRIPGLPLRHSGIETREITIGRNCWLASKVTVVAGTQLADDVTVAANAVVTGHFQEKTLIGGVPARVLRSSEAVQ